METNNLHLSKIKTHVSGLDDLFYGGLRLPDPHESKDMDGICIIIRGKQGVAKSDMAMQIMRGVTRSLAKDLESGSALHPFFCTLNHRTSEWKKKYRGLDVMETIESIKLPPSNRGIPVRCNLCLYFKDLRSRLGCVAPTMEASSEGCSVESINKCMICKLVRQEIITYNPRSQSMHWNVEGTSNERNFIAALQDEQSEVLPTKDIFPPDEWYGNIASYEPQPLYIFNKFKQLIHNAKEELYKSTDGPNNFRWSAVVVEGFSILEEDFLKRLPYIDLINDLRKVAAVSILVFDERAEKLQLKSDIIIEMRMIEDPDYKYLYRDMQIVKSDLQERIRGWHRVSMNHDIKAHVYPNISALMSKRFSKENAVVRLEHNRLNYPQTLLNRTWTVYDQMPTKERENISELMPKLVKDILDNKMGKDIPYDASNTYVHVELVKDGEYDNMMSLIKNELHGKDTTLAYILFGKKERNLRERISKEAFSTDDLYYIHCWEINFAYLWPEILADSIKQYVRRWILTQKQHTLHIVMDDFSFINQYPFLQKEKMLVPAIVNICNNELGTQGLKNNTRGINIKLTLVCTSELSSHYKVINQLSTIN